MAESLAQETAVDVDIQATPMPDSPSIAGSWIIAGPYATFQLALMGADVIKIEQPGIGDQGRQMYPLNEPYNDEGFSAVFMSANAGKRSLSLDLKHAAAAGVIERLMRGADVVVENFKAGTMGRLGFGWENLRKINEKYKETEE